MAGLGLVKHVAFFDEKSLLVTGSKNGVYVHQFSYEGKYDPKLAAAVDQKGNHIKLRLLNPQPVECTRDWCKGLKVQENAGLVISWTRNDPKSSINEQYLSINCLKTGGKLMS